MCQHANNNYSNIYEPCVTTYLKEMPLKALTPHYLSTIIEFHKPLQADTDLRIQMKVINPPALMARKRAERRADGIERSIVALIDLPLAMLPTLE